MHRRRVPVDAGAPPSMLGRPRRLRRYGNQALATLFGDPTIVDSMLGGIWKCLKLLDGGIISFSFL